MNPTIAVHVAFDQGRPLPGYHRVLETIWEITQAIENRAIPRLEKFIP